MPWAGEVREAKATTLISAAYKLGSSWLRRSSSRRSAFIERLQTAMAHSSGSLLQPGLQVMRGGFSPAFGYPFTAPSVKPAMKRSRK